MKPSIALPKGGLYLITPDDRESENFLARVLPVLSSGIAVLQYRNKLSGTGEMRKQALVLRQRCAELGIVFIINDDVELAEEVKADGVHLGEHDGDVRVARKRLGPGAIIGVSCYNSLSSAQRAAAEGASYIAFGAVYPSATKPHARHAELALFAQAALLGLPMVAIGGIRPDNAIPVLEAGADFLAVIGAVFDAAEPACEAAKFISCFQSISSTHFRVTE